ncbi:hypothetical protein StoSoilB5_06480 [Arthrobacter sp. StoSoilB5]|nr:hypothetical protein StoSoilB5_06480 [Arthrobacter sp. StoSoilB5]
MALGDQPALQIEQSKRSVFGTEVHSGDHPVRGVDSHPTWSTPDLGLSRASFNYVAELDQLIDPEGRRGGCFLTVN